MIHQDRTNGYRADGYRYELRHLSMDADIVGISERYNVEGVQVCITDDGRYLAMEPEIGPEGSRIYDKIMHHINMAVAYEEGPDEQRVEMIEKMFWDAAVRMGVRDEAVRTFVDIKYYIRREIIGYGIIDVLMNDDNIEDILCSSFDRNIRIRHKEYSGRFHTLETNIRFGSVREMEMFIQRIYGATGAEPTESKPISVTYMKDGSRISSTFGTQVSKPGPVIAIRKFPTFPFTITHMIQNKTLTAEMAAWIWTLLDAKAVGLIIGATGSGKTTLLSSLVSMMNPRWRILTIEDTLELQIPHEDWVRYHTRRSYGMLSREYDVTIGDLIDSSLTQRPDFEIIGEIRLRDMDKMFQAVGTGHGGLTTFHANSASAAMTRMRGSKISDGELALLWFSVRSTTVRIGNRDYRKVDDISEIVPDGSGNLSINRIFAYDVYDNRFQSHNMYESAKYVEACRVCGIRSKKDDMARRIDLLQKCVKEKLFDVNDVFSVLGRYYR